MKGTATNVPNALSAVPQIRLPGKTRRPLPLVIRELLMLDCSGYVLFMLEVNHVQLLPGQLATFTALLFWKGSANLYLHFMPSQKTSQSFLSHFSRLAPQSFSVLASENPTFHKQGNSATHKLHLTSGLITLRVTLPYWLLLPLWLFSRIDLRYDLDPSPNLLSLW